MQALSPGAASSAPRRTLFQSSTETPGLPPNPGYNPSMFYQQPSAGTGGPSAGGAAGSAAGGVADPAQAWVVPFAVASATNAALLSAIQAASAFRLPQAPREPEGRSQFETAAAQWAAADSVVGAMLADTGGGAASLAAAQEAVLSEVAAGSPNTLMRAAAAGILEERRQRAVASNYAAAAAALAPLPSGRYPPPLSPLSAERLNLLAARAALGVLQLPSHAPSAQGTAYHHPAPGFAMSPERLRMLASQASSASGFPLRGSPLRQPAPRPLQSSYLFH